MWLNIVVVYLFEKQSLLVSRIHHGRPYIVAGSDPVHTILYLYMTIGEESYLQSTQGIFYQL